MWGEVVQEILKEDPGKYELFVKINLLLLQNKSDLKRISLEQTVFLYYILRQSKNI